MSRLYDLVAKLARARKPFVAPLGDIVRVIVRSYRYVEREGIRVKYLKTFFREYDDSALIFRSGGYAVGTAILRLLGVHMKPVLRKLVLEGAVAPA